MLKPDLTAPVVTVLASGSPRRTELLKEFGIEHIIIKGHNGREFYIFRSRAHGQGSCHRKGPIMCVRYDKKEPVAQGEGSGSSLAS